MTGKLLPALLLIFFVSACSKLKDLEYLGLENVKMLKLGLVESTMGIDVRFYNPNRYRMQLKDADVMIYINSKFLGHANLDTLVVIPKKDTFSLPLTIKLETVSVVSNVLESFSDSTVLVKLEGNARLGKGGVFFNHQIRYEGMQKVKL